MPRIRSIKPEFATDGDMLNLSDACALFYILFWTHCDDEGKHRFDLKQIAAELGGRWHQGKIKLFVSCLIKSGQLRINSESTWLQVVQWSHQKIDKPKQPKVKAEDLQWLSESDSSKALDKSRGIDARIGSRIGGIKDQGSDHCESPPTEGTSPPIQAVLPIEKKSDPSPTALVWRSYAQAYKARYSTEPTQNASVMGKLKSFVGRVPANEAPEIAAFFVRHNSPKYLGSGHAVGLLLMDAEKLRTEWITGRKITSSDIRNSDSADSLNAQISRLTGGGK